MTAALHAVLRYQDAGLATDPQANVLSAVLKSEDAAAALDEAVLSGTPLTLEEVEANADPRYALNDRKRYIILFGEIDGRMNQFAMPAGDTQIDDLISAAVKRRSPITDAEIAHLNRNVSDDPSILY